jgi:cytochrome P450
LLGEESLFMQEGEDHRKLKNFLNGYFKRNDKGRMSEVFVGYSIKMMSIADRMAEGVAKRFQDGETSVNVYEIFRNSILEFTTSSLFGVQLVEEEIVSISRISEQMIDLENALFRKSEEGNPLLYPSMAVDFLRLNYLSSKTKKSFERILHRKVDSIYPTQETGLDTKIALLRENYNGVPKDLLDHMLCNPIEVDANGKKIYLSSQSIKDQMLSILMAGHITSTSANTTQLHYLEGQLKYGDPEFYAKWESEMENMDQLFQGLNDGKQWNELKGLYNHKFSSALMDESLRMHPINTSTWRMVMQDFEIEHNGTNLKFKKNQILSIDFEGMVKRFNRAHIKNPDQFNPRQLIEVSARVSQELMPFAYGTHHCIGEPMANTGSTSLLGRFIYSLHKLGFALQPVEGNMVTGVKESIQLPEKKYRTMKIVPMES